MGKKITKHDLYAARIFFNAALPLLRVVVESRRDLSRLFKGKSFVFQVTAPCVRAKGGRMATHFVVEDGKFTVKVEEIHPAPDIELAFLSLKDFILFFSGRGKPLPEIHGAVKHPLIFASLLRSLLVMANLLQATEAPKRLQDQVLLVKLYFYLLPAGISQLNKAGHEKIHQWALQSPDRAYAFAVTGYPALSSYVRVKEGNSKAGRGEYPRCKPFLTLRFDSPLHALDILMGKGDMIDYIAHQYLTVEGAPEFAAIIGDYLFTVGDYAKGLYLDWKETE